jgi:hypothetical protein
MDAGHGPELGDCCLLAGQLVGSDRGGGGGDQPGHRLISGWGVARVQAVGQQPVQRGPVHGGGGDPREASSRRMSWGRPSGGSSCYPPSRHPGGRQPLGEPAGTPEGQRSDRAWAFAEDLGHLGDLQAAQDP